MATLMARRLVSKFVRDWRQRRETQRESRPSSTGTREAVSLFLVTQFLMVFAMVSYVTMLPSRSIGWLLRTRQRDQQICENAAAGEETKGVEEGEEKIACPACPTSQPTTSAFENNVLAVRAAT